MRFFTYIIFSLISAGLFADNFYVEHEVSQGDIITFVVSEVTADMDYTFNIYNSKNKEILKVDGFNYYLYDEKISIVIGLGGVPSNLPPGNYKVKVTGRGLMDTFFSERSIVVNKTEYPRTILKANNKMSSIINGEIDEERENQSKKLWDTFSSFSRFILHEEEKLLEPISGRHTSAFGSQRVTKYPNGQESISIHKGEDLAAKIGTPVLSDGRGRVLLAENRIVTGNSVVIEHLPGVVSIYYHMDSIDVIRGDFIQKGDKIGEVGTTGYSTGPHLHWEVRIATVPVDPKQFLTKKLIDKSLIIDMISTTNNKRGG